MTQTDIIQLIHKHFPDVRWNELAFHDNGWDHAVAILDERLVFRAPRDLPESPPDKLLHEAGFLKHLLKQATIGLPNYLYMAEDHSIGGYEILKGNELSAENFRSLDEDSIESIVHQIAGFLNVLHTTPNTVANNFGLQEGKDYHSRDMFGKTEQLVLPKLNSQESAIVLSRLALLRATLVTSRPVVPVHLDLHDEHILWDGFHKQVSVIDFGDMALGDPAYDFAGFWDLGEAFARKVFDHYTGVQDEGILLRSRVFYNCFSISMMKDSFEGWPITFEYAYKRFISSIQDSER